MGLSNSCLRSLRSSFISFDTIKVLLIYFFVSAELQPDHVVLVHTGLLHNRAECEYLNYIVCWKIADWPCSGKALRQAPS